MGTTMKDDQTDFLSCCTAYLMVECSGQLQ